MVSLEVTPPFSSSGSPTSGIIPVLIPSFQKTHYDWMRCGVCGGVKNMKSSLCFLFVVLLLLLVHCPEMIQKLKVSLLVVAKPIRWLCVGSRGRREGGGVKLIPTCIVLAVLPEE